MTSQPPLPNDGSEHGLPDAGIRFPHTTGRGPKGSRAGDWAAAGHAFVRAAMEGSTEGAELQPIEQLLQRSTETDINSRARPATCSAIAQLAN